MISLIKNDLDNSLKKITENPNDAAATVFAVTKSDQLKLFDIKADDLPFIKDNFIESIDRNVIDLDATVIDISEADDRRSVIYRYDLDVPPDFDHLTAVHSHWVGEEKIEFFDIKNDSVSNISALIVRIATPENCVSLYKAMAPINLFQPGTRFFVKKLNRFERLEDEFLRISDNFQFFRTDDGEFFVLDLGRIEKLFGFHDVIKNEAKKGADAIREFGVLADVQPLLDLIDDISFARKLTRVASSSPVLKKSVDHGSIIQFCKNYPSLKNKIRFNADESQIVLDTRVSKDLFVRLLMDDYLVSQLTESHYESIAKDEADSSDDSDEDEPSEC